MESKLSFSRSNFHQNQFDKCFQWQSLYFWIAFFTQLLHVMNVFQANIITSIAFKIGSGSVAQTSTIWKYFVFWLFPDENIINAQTTLSARIIAIRASGWITHEELYMSNVEIFDRVRRIWISEKKVLLSEIPYNRQGIKPSWPIDEGAFISSVRFEMFDTY